MGKLNLQGSFCDTGCNLWWKHLREKRRWSRAVVECPGIYPWIFPASLSVLLCKYCQTSVLVFFKFWLRNQSWICFQLWGRVHHLQKRGKAEIQLAWRLRKPFSMVEMHVLRRAEGDWPFVLSLTQCWTGGEMDRSTALGAWLGLPSLGSSSWLNISSPRSASSPCTHVGLCSIIFRGRFNCPS